MGKTRTRALDPHLRGDDSKKAIALASPSDVIPDGTQRRAGIQVSASQVRLDPRLRGDDGKKATAIARFF